MVGLLSFVCPAMVATSPKCDVARRNHNVDDVRDRELPVSMVCQDAVTGRLRELGPRNPRRPRKGRTFLLAMFLLAQAHSTAHPI